MQELYQISVIPAYKPWRGFSNYYTADKEVFDFFAATERWMPDTSVSDFPERLRYLAVESTWDDEKKESVPYVPNGTEDWDDGMAIIDGEEVYLEMSASNILYNLETEAVQFPFILLGTAEAYTE